ncbi:hypothetical protein RZP13_26335, partial [Klebsiella quasipneumoniae subsp. similipneumoniae]|uniref:hypothetical protein n=1 Tax=Klebsiella quasipneumoniae TaxID=1463165 RepID=UPI00292BA84E
KRAYYLKTQPATGETYPKSDLFNKAHFDVCSIHYLMLMYIILMYVLAIECQIVTNHSLISAILTPIRVSLCW